MDSLDTAIATAPAVSAVGSHFMVDGSTYKKGAELGFQGLDFYVCGRGGVLGDVDADVVSAAFTFFEPGHVRTLWDQGRAVMPPAEASAAFAACCAAWAEEHMPDGFDATRLADLAGAVIAGARPACAPAFGGWRALPVPSAAEAAAVHQMNVLRELRNGLHGAAVIAAGLTPLQAVSIRSPQMVALFGWPEPADTEGLQAVWEGAEAQTDVAMAHAFEGLTDAERGELVDLAGALHAALSG